MNADITAVLAAAKDDDRVFINGTLMTSGSTYTFKLGKLRKCGKGYRLFVIEYRSVASTTIWVL